MSSSTVPTLAGRRQAIIWTNARILLIGPLGTNFIEIFIGIQTFSFKKWRPFCLGPNVLLYPPATQGFHLQSIQWDTDSTAVTMSQSIIRVNSVVSEFETILWIRITWKKKLLITWKNNPLKTNKAAADTLIWIAWCFRPIYKRMATTRTSSLHTEGYMMESVGLIFLTKDV